jgi:glutamine synthetase
MNSDKYKLSPNALVQYLDKPAQEFTKLDLMTFVEHNLVEMINFHYVADDGRLKTLNFVINSREHLNNLLSSGERVDGSSLFAHMEAGSSDLYVIPRYRTAFINPFNEIPTLDMLCTFFTKEGKPLESSPEYILKKAHKALIDNTGYHFEVMGELEYYVISEEDDLFMATDQKGYHESAPFNKMAEFRTEAMRLIAQCGGNIKYGHSEVGNFVQNGKNYEQNEIEFIPSPIEEAADQLLIAKWILRRLAYDYDIDLTFAPKITVGKAGSGLHIHTRLIKNGKNAFVEKGKLTDVAKKAIAGYLKLAPSLTAFGNTNPTSYFRLVPHQEAPTSICWGDRNRSTLVRVPLGWSGSADMAHIANPLEKENKRDFSFKQTAEFRCPDGSADIYLLLAGLTVAARHGLMEKDSLKFAKKTYVDINIFDDENKEKANSLEVLPTSCVQSAKELDRQRKVYLEYDVFTDDIIDEIISKLDAFKDENLRKEVEKKEKKMLQLVERFFYCG